MTSTATPVLTSIRMDCHADYLEPGDTIVAEGTIPIRVTSVTKAVKGFVVAGYQCTAGTGWRTYADKQHLTIDRPEPETSH